MKRFDGKKKPTKHYSVMVVPRGQTDIRRYEVSRNLIRFITAGAVFLGVMIFAAVISLIVYRSSYIATEDARVEASKFVTERANLLNRIEHLEEALGRVDRFASKIGSAVDVSTNSKFGLSSMTGHGPVEEETWLPALERSLSHSTSVRLGGNTWKSPFRGTLSEGLGFSLDKLTREMVAVEEKVHSVFALQKDRLYFWASLPTIWPAKGWITSEFGDRRGWGGRGRIHEGIDVAGPRGTPILAPGAGVITYVGYRRGYGRTVIVDHGYGIVTLYGHCQSIYVDEGQSVKRGMIIAGIGNTGRSTGPHLHYEVRVDGVPVNPMLYIMNDL